MKFNESFSEVFIHQEISPAAYKAQRMAELEQMAKYRALKLQAYKDWSVAEKREKIIKQAEADLTEARAIYAATPPKEARLEFARLEDRIRITPKPMVTFEITRKPSLWQRFKSLWT